LNAVFRPEAAVPDAALISYVDTLNQMKKNVTLTICAGRMIALEGMFMRGFLLAGLLFVVCCAHSSTASENRLLYQDGVAREMLVGALKAKSIAYRIDAEGGVWYPAEAEKTVDEIAKAIVLARFSGPATSFEDPVDVVSFRGKLAQAGIPYKTKLQHGREWTTWEKADDLRVKEIQEKVENENTERAKAERAKKQEKSTQKVPGSN